jgi:hypothetical protein
VERHRLADFACTVNAANPRGRVQAEAIRLAMSALTVRAASERLAVVAQLATGVKGGAP